MNEPVIQIPVDQVLGRFAHGTRWIQGDWSTESGECLHQGIRQCMPQLGDAFLIEQVAAKHGWGTDWNDTDGVTFDDVKQVLVTHREVFPDELEATFGPQWQRVVMIVRQTASLTEDQAEKLGAARATASVAAQAAARATASVAARAAAWDAGWDAAWDAAWDAGWDAAQAATRSAAWDAAQVAAQAAAQGAVVFDLVGEHGFTQDHYDTLVGPWETVMGTEATR